MFYYLTIACNMPNDHEAILSARFKRIAPEDAPAHCAETLKDGRFRTVARRCLMRPWSLASDFPHENRERCGAAAGRHRGCFQVTQRAVHEGIFR